MIEYNEKRTNILKVILAVIIVVWSYATISYGFYVDENGLLAIYKGIFQGQHRDCHRRQFRSGPSGGCI